MNHLKYHQYDHAITCIETWYEREGLASCYLLEADGQVALIDTGTAFTAPHIIELLDKYGISKEQVKYIIPTHVHLDHAGGAGQLMSLLPDATLIIHPYGARHMIDPSKLQAGASAVYGEEKFKLSFDQLMPIDKARVIEMHDGMELDLNGRKLHLIDTPGHARHHLCVWDELSKGLFTGDVFGNGYPELVSDKGRYVFPVTSPVQLDPPAWHESIDKLMAFNPQHIFLTHYGQLENHQDIALQDMALQGIAKQLHSDLDAYIGITNEAVQTNRYETILEELTAYHYKKITEHGCNFSNQELDLLIGSDLVLCAQGLEVMLQRQEENAAKNSS